MSFQQQKRWHAAPWEYSSQQVSPRELVSGNPTGSVSVIRTCARGTRQKIAPCFPRLDFACRHFGTLNARKSYISSQRCIISRQAVNEIKVKLMKALEYIGPSCPAWWLWCGCCIEHFFWVSISTGSRRTSIFRMGFGRILKTQTGYWIPRESWCCSIFLNLFSNLLFTCSKPLVTFATFRGQCRNLSWTCFQIGYTTL